MKDTKKTNLKVGITVVVSIIILIYGVAFLKGFKLEIETSEFTVYFNEVNGLKEGDQVSVNGVPKGKVTNIELSGDSVKVTFYVSKDIVLKKDYKISIAMIELMSGKQVYIKPGTDPEPADISKPLIGEKSNDVVSLIQTMNSVGDQVNEVTLKLNQTIDNLNIAVNNINDIAGDERFKSDIKGTASSFNSASKNLNLLITENGSSIRKLTGKLNTIADNLDDVILETKPELKGTIQDIRDLTSKMDSLTANLNTLILDVKDSSSTVGKLLTDDEVYENLNKTVKSINKLIEKIDKDGLRLRIF